MTDTVNVPSEALELFDRAMRDADVSFYHAARQTLHQLLAAAPKADPLHDSDCAMHNEPAYPNAPCDCSASRPEAPKVEQKPELKADFTRAHPSGMDDCTYSEIEDVLDRKDAPVFGRLGLPLTLAQRVDALTHPAPASDELPDELDLFRIIRDAGRTDAEKARAVHQAIAKHKGPQS